MVIDIFHELLRGQHFVIVQRLPAALVGIVGGVEDNAVRVQMRVQSARGFMIKERGDDVSGQTIRTLQLSMHLHGGEAFEFPHGSAYRRTMRRHNPTVIRDESRDRHRLRR